MSQIQAHVLNKCKKCILGLSRLKNNLLFKPFNASGVAVSVGMADSINLGSTKPGLPTLHYITCHLADAFIQSDLQLIRLSRRHTPWSNVGLRALLRSKSTCLSATPQAAPALDPS